MAPLPWIVLKFGGTSVATATNWGRIADRVRTLLPTHRVWVVASALSQVSNRLEAAMAEALADEPLESWVWIRNAHEQLASDIGIAAHDYAPVAKLLEELRHLLEGIRLTREASPRLRARVMSFGELASTYLGIAALHHHRLIGRRVDARDLLRTTPAPNEPEERRYLGADVRPARDPDAAEAAAGGAGLVLTQGFIASNGKGETCLLGRGGSDTSAALFAALLDAEALEIWTDVHGLFTTDPRQIPAARLIEEIGFREAEELAAMGAKVLHPRCLGPARWAGIPVRIKNTRDPSGPGTHIGPVDENEPAVTAVVKRSGVTLLTIQTLDMWGASGFLAQVFGHFEALGMSIDLVATSQAAVSLTLDYIPGGTGGEAFGELLERLGGLGDVTVVDPCAVVSIVGRRIRTVLHELGPAMAVFREHEVHLVSESSEDLNLSFVVDEEDAAKLVAALHARLLPRQGGGDRFGPTWELLGGGGGAAAATAPAVRWWRARRDELLALAADGEARYVYDLATVRARAQALRTRLVHVGTVFYAIKANPHPDVLRTIASEGLGMECVSAGEVDHVRAVLGDAVPILFTPNVCPVGEYAHAAAAGAEVTIDGVHLVPHVGAEFAVRLDPGEGLGHHEKVRTAGAHAKFGQPLDELDLICDAAQAAGKRVVGLHSHVGSGILEAGAWARTAELFAALADRLPDLRWIDVGGGLGVVERPGQQPLDLDAVNESLAAIAARLGSVELRMEPGRYLVSEAGVLLAPVTQVRSKGDVRFVGVATGMNSLLRPALYGAWHGIHNLTRVDDAPAGYAHVVGPICETGDVLGRDRLLPETAPGDVLLIENAGAYGRAMSSSYNLRPPAAEVVLPG